ncbi:MAG: hypothetical protein DMD96_31015 [Candidatus Rokuibacteriota bacterium]|nr:MAG: hypothetical protein DMD96_31015 [Candidatus Rokubacteria bacterium]
MFARSTTSECVPNLVGTTRILDLLATGKRANPRAPLLIRGEPGVGKDSLARLLHEASGRGRQPFIKVSCAGQPADRHDAELFGHEKGTSPLASRRRLGSFEFANHGTLYLDDIGALPHALVPKLLDVLRTGEVSRIGDERTIVVDVRLIASTAHDAATRDGDLWAGLCSLDAVELLIPPLRQRMDEIPVLASFFVDQLNRRYGRHVQLCPDVIAAFQAQAWPGNVRELADAVHRMVLDGATAPVH